ncbi:hypothetical protein Q8F55_000089 [Vanrija albida]|uniref:Defective in cullin neddylation protein n=1 Tax=Vanrija albida TaxID=181172 RepID=A0ABR3QC92_9TREE
MSSQRWAFSFPAASDSARARQLNPVLTAIGMSEDDALALGSRYSNHFLTTLERSPARRPTPAYPDTPPAQPQPRVRVSRRRPIAVMAGPTEPAPTRRRPTPAAQVAAAARHAAAEFALAAILDDWYIVSPLTAALSVVHAVLEKRDAARRAGMGPTFVKWMCARVDDIYDAFDDAITYPASPDWMEVKHLCLMALEATYDRADSPEAWPDLVSRAFDARRLGKYADI